MIRVDGSGKSNALIQVRGLDKTYRRGGEEIQVLQRLNLDVDKGDFVGFMGPSGSAKTTLLNLLCDEPTGDLDRKSADEIMELIHRLVKEFGKTVLMVTHDPVVAKRADLTLHLEKGLLVESGALSVTAGGVA